MRPFRLPPPPGAGYPPFRLPPRVPLTGQFFNTGPIQSRPLLTGLPHAGIQLPVRGISGAPYLGARMAAAAEKLRLSTPPKTTIFVGNISEELDNDLIHKILDECGQVNEWRRLQGANGVLQAFGFCEFNHPDATRRSLRLLNGFHLGGKALNIKVEDKVKDQIRKFSLHSRQDQGLPPLGLDSHELPFSDEDRDQDILTRERILKMVQDVDKNLLRIPEPEPPPPVPKKVSSSSEDSASEEDRRKSKRQRRRRSRSWSRSPRGRDGHRSNRRKGQRHRHSKSGSPENEHEDKEAAYRRQVRKWEEKEARFAREMAKNKDREERRLKFLEREARKLKKFHEDYDDDVDDAKYYSGDNFHRRKAKYDLCVDRDSKEEAEELAQLEKIKSEILANPKSDFRVIKPESLSLSSTNGHEDNSRHDEEPPTSSTGWAAASPSAGIKLPSLGKKISVQKIEVQANGIFAEDADDDEPAKKKMKPFKITSEDRILTVTPDERKRMIRNLIDTIPKSRDQIFAYPLHWELLDESLVDSKIRPWVTKKVGQFIGENEPALVKFICDSIQKQTEPQKLIGDLSLVFEDEASPLVIKMWRLMIYETEARRTGLSAPPPSFSATGEQQQASTPTTITKGGSSEPQHDVTSD